MNIQPWQFFGYYTDNNFSLRLAIRVDRNFNYFCSIFLPLVEFFGVNPYFFAMLIALNLQTSFFNPPMAMSAYYLKEFKLKMLS